MILFIVAVYCYRLLKLKLKESEDLYVTNADGNLKLLPSNEQNLGRQTVVVHSRRLFFIRDGILYKMYLNPGSLDIKLKKDEVRKIGFLKSAISRKKRINPFGFKRPKKQDGMSPKEFSKAKSVKKDDNMKTEVKQESINKRDAVASRREPQSWSFKKEEDSPRRQPTNSKPKTSRIVQPVVDDDDDDGGTFEKNSSLQPKMPEDDDTKQLEVLKTILASLEQKGESEEIDFTPQPRTKVDGVVSKIKKYFGKTTAKEDESNYIESDSKIDEDSLKYQQVDVFVSSLDKTYFKLKTTSNNCVTFMNNSFIFTPCINIDNQIFKMEKEEEVKKKLKKRNKGKIHKKKHKEEYKDDSESDDSSSEDSRVIEPTHKRKHQDKHRDLLSYNKRMRSEYKDESESPEETTPNCQKGSPDYYEEICYPLPKDKEEEEFAPSKPLDKSSRFFTNLKKKAAPVQPFTYSIGTSPSPPTVSSPPVSTSNTQSGVSENGKSLVSSVTFSLDKNNKIKQPNPINNYPSNGSPNKSTIAPNLIRSIVKNETAKKDFNPDDIIEKLKKSINSNDFADLI